MDLDRGTLLFNASMLAAFGTAALVAPRFVISKVDLEPVSPTGNAEARAMYGGLELGLAAFFAYAATQPDLIRPALLAQACALGGLAAGRAVGFAADRPRKMLYAFGALEAATAILSAVQFAKNNGRHKDRRKSIA